MANIWYYDVLAVFFFGEFSSSLFGFNDLIHLTFSTVLVEQVVFCKLADRQQNMYKAFVNSKVVRMETKDGKLSASSLAFINQIKKLCNRKFQLLLLLLVSIHMLFQCPFLYSKMMLKFWSLFP